MKTAIFFKGEDRVYLLELTQDLSQDERGRIAWALCATAVDGDTIAGKFIGPRKEMVSPWSTNAVEIFRAMGVTAVERVETFVEVGNSEAVYDHMLEAVYRGLTRDTLVIDQQPQPVVYIKDIAAYNKEQGLALSDEEVTFLQTSQKQLGRDFTDSEIYAFAQINSEHCRHKIFNGQFVIDGEVKPDSLFSLIKRTSKEAPEQIVSAYKDNVAFFKGKKFLQFAPSRGTTNSVFSQQEIDAVVSLKAETHNFPTIVEPFFGASTGSGGEIRDRMAGGIGSIPMAGTAVYMTSYPRLESSRAEKWEKQVPKRKWKFQTPLDILIKASNGASDFGNKFGLPLISGSLLTFEQETSRAAYGYDRAVMMAGGIGYARSEYAQKSKPVAGDALVLIGGDNYRIGMAGSSVSSVDSGAVNEELELSAVQRANPEMQKRVFNAIRAFAENEGNPIRMIHDHGAGGHVNCFSELVEEGGGRIDIDALPVGDPTLSAREIICNESQERMGLIVPKEHVAVMKEIAERERAPLYVVGEADTSQKLVLSRKTGDAAIDLPLELLFGSSPKTVMEGSSVALDSKELELQFASGKELVETLRDVLSIEAVACKDWLTNKVDRSVTGKVAQQQCVGKLQLPLSNVAVMALDFTGKNGIATSIGHASVAAVIDEAAGSRLSIAEALTNIVWAPLSEGLASVVLSANWMWPAKQNGENARLYNAVQAVSDFAVELGISIPTGKDSLSMTMNYPDGTSVRAPGTVIISAAGCCDDVTQIVTPDLKDENSVIVYLNLSGQSESPLGGSSLAQTKGVLGASVPDVVDANVLKAGFGLVQKLVRQGKLLAGHDVSSGGFLSALCEMAFAGDLGLSIALPKAAPASLLFSEKPSLLLQVSAADAKEIIAEFERSGGEAFAVATVGGAAINFSGCGLEFNEPLSTLRRDWFYPSYLLDKEQTKPEFAKERFETFDKHPLNFKISAALLQADKAVDIRRAKPGTVKAAIIREKGTNGDREMAFAMHAAGFAVHDITMSDLVSGRATLADKQFIVFPGGFSNSDVLGAGRGWAGAFKYNERAREEITNFFARPDVLSLGVCNGCQLVTALEELSPFPGVQMNHNASGKFESTFVSVDVVKTNSVLLEGLEDSRLGIWVAHGEGKFSLAPDSITAMQFVSESYPANPNGSPKNTAAIVSADGRHLAMMPHLERSLFTWQWGYWPGVGTADNIAPWFRAFGNAYRYFG